MRKDGQRVSVEVCTSKRGSGRAEAQTDRPRVQIGQPSGGLVVAARSWGSGGYTGRFLLAVRGPEQRIERGVCPVPRRIEVAAIKRDHRARGFLDRVRLIREHLTAGIRKSRRQPADRVELTDQHRGRCCGGLTDLIERELGEALKPHRWHPHPELAARVVPVPLQRRPLSQREQRVGEPVHASHAGVRERGGSWPIGEPFDVREVLSWLAAILQEGDY